MVTKAEAKALAKAAYSNKTPKGPEIHDKKDGKNWVVKNRNYYTSKIIYFVVNG